MGTNEVGLVLIGIIAFFLGVAVTMFCYTLKNNDRKEHKQHKKESDMF
jgi:hypothetical protein